MASKKRIRKPSVKKEVIKKEIVKDELLVDTTPKVEYSNNYISSQNSENTFPGDEGDNFDDDFWRRYIINQQEIISDLVKKNMLLNTEMQRLQGMLELQETKINISSSAAEFKDQMVNIANKQAAETKKQAKEHADRLKEKEDSLQKKEPDPNFNKYMFRPDIKKRIAQLREKPKQEENINKEKKPKPIIAKEELYHFKPKVVEVRRQGLSKRSKE
tara:strand:- start:1531 stop:2178 length:648 start_codon:yes stop_codon:yes gene_type:complete